GFADERGGAAGPKAKQGGYRAGGCGSTVGVSKPARRGNWEQSGEVGAPSRGEVVTIRGKGGRAPTRSQVGRDSRVCALPASQLLASIASWHPRSSSLTAGQ